MATLEPLNTLLTVAARLLDQAASETRDARFPPVHENIESIGRALSEVFQLQHKIYEIRPDLKPEFLNEVSPSLEADRLLTRYMGEAIGLEQSGDITGAIEKLKEFVLLETTPHHREIAIAEIERLGDE